MIIFFSKSLPAIFFLVKSYPRSFFYLFTPQLFLTQWNISLTICLLTRFLLEKMHFSKVLDQLRVIGVIVKVTVIVINVVVKKVGGRCSSRCHSGRSCQNKEN